MQKVTLLTLGKLKEPYLREASAEYQKRLKGLCDLEVVELDPTTLPEHPSQAQIDAALQAEEQKIFKKIPNGAYCVALCIEGKQCSSPRFAEMLAQKALDSKPLCFIIGSSYGLSPAVKKRADLQFSFSQMTFPHQLARILFLEQLYRGFKINQGSAYHK